MAPISMAEDGGAIFSDVFVVTDYQSKNLSNLFEFVKADNFTLDHALTIVYNLLCAVNFLHSADLCQLDLMPENIFLTGNCNVIIAENGYRSGATSSAFEKQIQESE